MCLECHGGGVWELNFLLLSTWWSSLNPIAITRWSLFLSTKVIVWSVVWSNYLLAFNWINSIWERINNFSPVCFHSHCFTSSSHAIHPPIQSPFIQCCALVIKLELISLLIQSLLDIKKNLTLLPPSRRNFPFHWEYDFFLSFLLFHHHLRLNSIMREEIIQYLNSPPPGCTVDKDDIKTLPTHHSPGFNYEEAYWKFLFPTFAFFYSAPLFCVTFLSLFSTP